MYIASVTPYTSADSVIHHYTLMDILVLCIALGGCFATNSPSHIISLRFCWTEIHFVGEN